MSETLVIPVITEIWGASCVHQSYRRQLQRLGRLRGAEDHLHQQDLGEGGEAVGAGGGHDSTRDLRPGAQAGMSQADRPAQHDQGQCTAGAGCRPGSG